MPGLATRGAPSAGTAPAHAQKGAPARWPGWMAYAILAVPFGIVLVRYAASSSSVFLSDDLALIDLHTRSALHFQQQLGPFDRFGWNHPGPALFYLLSLPARVFSSGARAEFVGAILINALAALAVVWVVRRRAGPWAALWASSCVAVLLVVMAVTGHGEVTYSEGAAGALVSPWNPTVVMVPTLLVAVLAAAAVSGSPLSLLGGMLVGSFCVQTDISTVPVVGALLVLAAIAVVIDLLRGRHRARSPLRLRGRPLLWLVLGLVVLVAMWIPPLVQQVTGHPGNLTAIWRFFTSAHQTHGLSAGLWSVTAVDSALVFGPSYVMVYPLGQPGPHAGLVLALVLVVGIGSLAVALLRRQRFATALGVASLVGFAIGIYSVTEVVGPVWGYLLLWEACFPLLAIMALGTALLAEPRWAPSARVAQVAATAAAMVLGVALCYRVAVLPPLSAVSNQEVKQSVGIVTSHVRPREGPVAVQDAGLPLVQTEVFIGLVNQLDERGYRPRVSPFWKVQFGAGLVETGHEHLNIVLEEWKPSSRTQPGYIGRAGVLAVLLQHGSAL